MGQIWVMALSVCFIFTITIGIFPAVTVEVKSTVADGGDWGEFLIKPLLWTFEMQPQVGNVCSEPSAETYFIPVSCFLLFNMMDWAGRSLTAFCMWVSNSSFL